MEVWLALPFIGLLGEVWLTLSLRGLLAPCGLRLFRMVYLFLLANAISIWVTLLIWLTHIIDGLL